MSVRASCGHTLTEDEGADGMGWQLAVKSYSRESTPAVHYGSYCTACRDEAMAQPGHVLADDAAEFAWLRSEEAPDLVLAPNPSLGAVALQLPSYGVWSVWNADPRNAEDVANHLMGTYRGFVDDIALAVAWSDRAVAYFRREADESPAEGVHAYGDASELPECVGLNVIQGEGLLADDIGAIEPFFAGRPVFVKYSGWGDCVSLFPATGETGTKYIRQQANLRTVLSKLTAEDIAILKDNGLFGPSVPLLIKGSNRG